MDWNKLLLDKEHLETEKSHLLQELKKLKEELKDNRKTADKAEKQKENLEETNIQLRNELESLKEKMKMTDEEAKNKLDASEENVRNTEKETLKKEKQLKTLENKVTTLQLELENISKLHKGTIDSYRNEIEVAKAAEKKLLKEVEKIQSVADEATAMQKVLDIQCQHKITEMVVLMEKHKIYTVKTPPKSKLLKEGTNLLSEEGTQKKRKVFLELDSRSESSESNDLLSITSEQERLKKLYKDYPQASCLCAMTPKKVHTPSSQKTPGSSVKFAAMRKIRDAGWTAVSKMDRRKKMKEAGKLFA